MQKSNKISKSILFITLISFCIYIGSYLTKLLLLNQFFDAETMELKVMYANQNLTLAIQSLLPSFSVSLFSYVAFLLLFICYIVYTKINLKNNGWLLIIVFILLITTPFELFLIFKFDIPVIKNLLNTIPNTDLVISEMKNRITELGPFPLILLFSNFLIIFLATFKPLQKAQ